MPQSVSDIARMRVIAGRRWIDGPITRLLDAARPRLVPRLRGRIRLAVDADTERRDLPAESLLRALVDSSPHAIFALDRDGNVRLWSPAAERLTGWAADEVLGRPLPIVPEEEREAFEAQSLRSASGETLRDIAAKRMRRDGVRFDASHTVAPLRSAGGDVTGLIAILSDVTEQRLLEAQLMEARKMGAIGRLAGGVAHDFNNLLTAISGFSDLLLSDLDAGDPRREDVGEIRDAAVRAKALTCQLLAFSRRQVLNPEVLDLNDVVDEITPLLRRLIGEDITLRAVTIADLGRVRADRAQLEHVIVSLAIDARDALPDGGSLTLETAKITFEGQHAALHPEMAPGEYVVLAISAGGIGLDESTTARFFEPAHGPSEGGLGPGLSLADVGGIVKRSGGHIVVQSEPSSGSTFKIYLPRTEADDPVAVHAQAEPIGTGSETVLVVEDDLSVRALTTEILRRNGYTALVASNTAEAFTVIGSHPDRIDLLVTDVIMPGLSGPELAQQLTRMRPGMRVLYVSGYADETIAHHGILEPGVAFLAKPFTPDTFARKVREVLASVA